MKFQTAALFVLLVSRALSFAQTEVVIDFEGAEITGRWIESWEEKGVLFTPAHEPTKSKAKARIMFFPHYSTVNGASTGSTIHDISRDVQTPPPGKPIPITKGILSAMADDPIPVKAQFPNGASSVTLKLWGSTGCAALLEAFDKDGKVVDTASLDVIPGRKAPGDPIPIFELTVKAEAIAYIEFSGPRVGEYLAADELRFTPLPAPFE